MNLICFNASLRKQKGLATVELALVTPFLLVMMLASAEFTRVFYEYNTLTKGVRDAARFMAEDAYNAAQVFEMPANKLTAARNIVVYGNINGTGTTVLDGLELSDVTIQQQDLGTAPLLREHIEVTVNHNFEAVPGIIASMGFLPQDVSLNFTLTASSTMRGL